MPMPDLRFTHLAENPVEPLRHLISRAGRLRRQTLVAARAKRTWKRCRWSDEIRRQANQGAAEVFEELRRLEMGLARLESDELLQRSFCLMNLAILHSARGHGYNSWRPFQMGFLLQALPFLVDRESEADVVDTVWFATGGGKTETYLGLLVTAALHDRLTGKTTGVTAWSRFPLRMLSMQQTQRFADALAGAELVRRAEAHQGRPDKSRLLRWRSGNTEPY